MKTVRTTLSMLCRVRIYDASSSGVILDIDVIRSHSISPEISNEEQLLTPYRYQANQNE